MSEKNNASDSKLAIKNTIIDTRPWTEKFGDFIDGGEGVFMIGLVLAGAILFVPSMAEVFFLAGLVFLYMAKKRKYFLPIRMPVSFKGIDENDVRPDGKFHTARGVFYFGNEIKSKKELWFAADDVKTHMVIFGTTGAGKALRDDEFVLTEHSWKRNKDLQKGDFVQTPNNGLSEILGIYPQGEKELAELTFSDGRVVRTTWDHLWTFYDANKTSEHSEFVKPAESIYTKTQAIQDHIKKGITLALPYSLPKGYADSFFNASEFLDWWDKAILSSNASATPLIRLSHAPLETRIAIWKQMMDHVLLYPEIAKHFGNTSTFNLSETLSNGLVFLARSLGLWAGIENKDQMIAEDDQEHYFELAEKINFNDGFDYRKLEKDDKCKSKKVVIKLNTPITLLNIKDSKVKESCRCIQIEDPNGLFITRQHIVTHNTETLVSITYNALVQGSGFVYVDGKGDNGLWGKVMGCARQCGREGEVLVVNYMTGGEESFGLPSSKNSNTLNPLVTGTSATLVELVSSLMDAAGSDPMWKSRAVALLQGIMPPLVYMRNRGEIILDVDIIRNYMNLPNIEKLTTRDDLPPSTLEGVKSYLDSLPGYVWGEEKQEADTMQQHGFLQMQFTRIFSMLADVYGFIFRTNLSEIVFHDIVVNRRILVVLLPALEKDPEGLSQLGKIILACLRQMMSTGLGSKLEGEHRTIIDAKPTAGPAPFLAILDEYGYYVTKGAAVMPAQARSLGVGMVFAGQDYAAFKKNENQSEAQSTVANCITKVFMKIVESEDTYGLFKSLVGEATVAKSRGLDKENGKLVSQNNVSYESVAKATLGDLASQTEGLAHIIFKDYLIKTKMFFCNPPQLKEYRLNYFLRVEPIKPDDAHKFINSLKTLKHGLMDPDKMDQINQTLKMPDVILSLSEAFKIGQKEERSSIELGIISLVGQSIAQSLQMGQNKVNVENLRKKSGRLKEQFKSGRTNVFNQNERTPWDEENPQKREPFGGRGREKIRFEESHKTDEDTEEATERTEETSESTENEVMAQRMAAREEMMRRSREKAMHVPKKGKAIEKLNEINEKIEPVEKKEREAQVKSTESIVQNLEQLTNYPEQKPSTKDMNEVLDIIRSLEDELTTTSENSTY